MIDFSDIGRDAFLVQFEDIISLMGLNVVRYIRKMKHQPYDDELTLAYLNRKEFDMGKFVYEQTSMNFPYQQMLQSRIACEPNLAYAFKMIATAYQNGIKSFYIHSNAYSPIIERFVNSLEIKTKYVHGDILPVLHDLPNCTYTTSDPNNIRKCLNADVPFALTIVDDFQYMFPIVSDETLIESLRKHNVYVQFTGVISAGIL